MESVVAVEIVVRILVVANTAVGTMMMVTVNGLIAVIIVVVLIIAVFIVAVVGIIVSEHSC